MKPWMLPALVFALPGGIMIALGVWAYRRFTRNHVSTAWLANQDRLSSRTEFHGVSFDWPINKARNEQAEWNSWQLRRRA